MALDYILGDEPPTDLAPPLAPQLLLSQLTQGASGIAAGVGGVKPQPDLTEYGRRRIRAHRGPAPSRTYREQLLRVPDSDAHHEDNHGAPKRRQDSLIAAQKLMRSLLCASCQHAAALTYLCNSFKSVYN